MSRTVVCFSEPFSYDDRGKRVVLVVSIVLLFEG